MVINLVDISGKPVDLVAETIAVLSGNIYVMSGFITADSGLHVLISGQPVTISGDRVYVESGARVVTTVASGQGVSGDHIIISGQPVTISGDHVYQESGAFVTSEAHIMSGIIRIGELGSAKTAEIDRTIDGIVTITTTHHEIHEGHMWQCDAQTSGLADDGTVSMEIITGSGLEVHSVFTGQCAGDAWFELYEKVVTSGDGVACVLNCMNRYVSGTPKTAISENPTVGTLGTKLSVTFIPGGQVGKATGGTLRPTSEWVLTGVSGPLNYLARLINVAGATKDAQIGIEFYEHTPGY